MWKVRSPHISLACPPLACPPTDPSPLLHLVWKGERDFKQVQEQAKQAAAEEAAVAAAAATAAAAAEVEAEAEGGKAEGGKAEVAVAVVAAVAAAPSRMTQHRGGRGAAAIDFGRAQ